MSSGKGPNATHQEKMAAEAWKSLQSIDGDVRSRMSFATKYRFERLTRGIDVLIRTKSD